MVWAAIPLTPQNPGSFAAAGVATDVADAESSPVYRRIHAHTYDVT